MRERDRAPPSYSAGDNSRFRIRWLPSHHTSDWWPVYKGETQWKGLKPRVLLAGASGTSGTPPTRQLIAARREVVGISRSQTNAGRCAAPGAEAVVADVLDRESPFAAVRGVRADAVMHQLTRAWCANGAERGSRWWRRPGL
ncbi:NAD-dependent epimerase/dehydratase family protein [Micromonospora echinaurantiaca]|uniref:NAD-dependent epimerase/dehydratase family protein n=1 Tax=Micromonospora echinaurantiaca TaxID=47857 RepID=UPI0037B8CD57